MPVSCRRLTDLSILPFCNYREIFSVNANSNIPESSVHLLSFLSVVPIMHMHE
jgi:hypothetical protein